MDNIIIIDQEDINFLQKLDFEKTSRQNLILFLINEGIQPDNIFIKKYENEYQDYFEQFNIAKQKIEQKYLKGIKYNNWHISYIDKELTYS